MNDFAGRWRLWERRPADFLLFGVTAVELGILLFLTTRLTVVDWIYICSNLLVLGIALTRRPAREQDRSIVAGAAVLVSYAYPYAQVVLLRWLPGYEAWPAGALVLITIGACLSLASLISLGRFFGVRPALRGLTTMGPYRVVRHPLYLAYVLQDVGYNLQEWSIGTLILVAAGWASMIYRIHAEERVLSHDANWSDYASRVRYRLLPGIW
ncbi:MAG TPA: methyltransferase [Tepidisphaeraceae bacterium]